MTPKQILLAAAELIESEQEEYCCIALKDVCGAYQYTMREKLLFWRSDGAYRAALEKFTTMYKPSGESHGGVWFKWGDKEGRVAALKATAATFD